MADYTAKRIGDMEGFYRGLFLKARDELGAKSFGLAVVELEPNSDAHPLHEHEGAGQEEVYVVLRGTGEMEVEDDRIPLDSETIVRVGPGAKRRIHPGAEGMRLLAIGGVPGQAYDPPSYSQVGAPDPMA